MDHADRRYLEAKRSVDARAIDRRVRGDLLAALPDRPRVFDAGAGTGTTAVRLRDWGVEPAAYLGVDRDGDCLAYAGHARAEELARRGAAVERTDAGFRVGDADHRFRADDALAAARDRPGEFDLVVAASFLDLVDRSVAFAAFERALAPGGLLYAPVTFDGVTVFDPAHPDDDAVLAAYHDAIDGPTGRNSRAGRRCLSALSDRDGTLRAVGGSDWIVRPRDGAYPADERYFLGCILDFVAAALADAPVDADDWLATRRRQLAAGELTYVAHNYDICYRSPEP